jgi:DNA-binding response OmpR family regulator
LVTTGFAAPEIVCVLMTDNCLILITEDDPDTALLLERALQRAGHRTAMAGSGEAALRLARQEAPDLILLDWDLPGIDGLEVCRSLRTHATAPILMVTGHDSIADRVKGLGEGADDYLVKPFDMSELLARVQALLRRSQPRPPATLVFADVTLWPEARRATRGERDLTLTKTEFDLLEALLRHPRQVLRRERLLEQVWGYDFDGEDNVLDVYIRYVRQKLEAGGEPRLIQTVRGIGFALRAEEV